jgi:hypothetical protein
MIQLLPWADCQAVPHNDTVTPLGPLIQLLPWADCQAIPPVMQLLPWADCQVTATVSPIYIASFSHCYSSVLTCQFFPIVTAAQGRPSAGPIWL